MSESFIKQAGSDVGMGTDPQEPKLLIGVGCPDWVTVPDHPGLPGGRRTCHAVLTAPCKVPGHTHPAQHYVLDGPVWCCECEVSVVFQWFKAPQEWLVLDSLSPC